MKMPLPARFPYVTSRSEILKGVVVAMLIAAFFLFAAAGGKEFEILGGLRIPSGVVKVIAALSTAACLYALVVAMRLRRLGRLPQFVELTQTGILVPRSGLNGGLLDASYSDILNVSQMEIAGTRLLVITTSVGESRLLASEFTSFGDFTKFYSALQAAWLANKSLERTRER